MIKPAVSEPKQQKNWKKKLHKFDGLTYPLIVLVVLVAAWEAVVRIGNIPYSVLPAPSNVMRMLFKLFGTEIWPHFLITLQVLVTGFLIAIPLGILFAALLSQYTTLNLLLSPLVVLWVTMPMLATLPLIMMWLGYGLAPRILVVSITASGMVALNSVAGFRKVEREKLELMASMGAGKWQTFFKCVFPNALPSVFAGIRLGCINATLTTLGVEIAGFGSGIGSRITLYATLIDLPVVFACILITILIGVTLFTTTSFVERKILYWK